jgi:hypothetical protein
LALQTWAILKEDLTLIGDTLDIKDSKLSEGKPDTKIPYMNMNIIAVTIQVPNY